MLDPQRLGFDVARPPQLLHCTTHGLARRVAGSFEDGLKLVKLRGESMQAAADATPSAMVSVIGLDADKVITQVDVRLCFIAYALACFTSRQAYD